MRTVGISRVGVAPGCEASCAGGAGCVIDRRWSTTAPGLHAAAAGCTWARTLYVRPDHAGDDVDCDDQCFWIVGDTGLVAALPL